MLQASWALHQLLLLKPWPWGGLDVFRRGPGYFYMLPGFQLRACYPSTPFLALAVQLWARWGTCGPRVSDGVLGYS